MAAIILTQNLVLVNQANPITTNAGQICYQTFTRGITPTVSGTASGYYAGALSNGLTHEFWKGDDTPATAYWDFGEAKSFSYVAIGAHNISSVGATVSIAYSNDASAWTSIGQVDPENDHALIFFFNTVSARYMRITVDGPIAPTIGVVYCGVPLEVPRGLLDGHSPVTLSRDIESYPQKSISNQWLGHSIVSRGMKSQANWQHLGGDWYREYFDPFVKSAARYPFFFAWRPVDYPNEVALCYPDTNIKPTYMGIRDWVQTSIQLNAYGVDA